MTAKKTRGTGRVTPKGTKNPTKATKAKRTDRPEATSGTQPHERSGKAGKQSGKVARPMTRNRGNR